MANQKKSKVVGKRPYSKKSSFWNGKKSVNFTQPEDNRPVIMDVKEDNEIKELSLACDIIDGWSDEQKARNLQFIFSKYSKHVNKLKVV